ncbi:DNA-directed RNA polymerase subunit beta [Candidatus Xianfuyuplasma coldseepsis]|uniref:DNA-directed RNA polymerase subunit beta n=1 Tax=Candidatus Xianfuyuplasma coldseepsis TaxID=2782163 RepID=A0A7L7KUB1_9MOLU|nr:DNA-directed RNA polymerase subunit beta [Xianfuyuplasma coldseepsis]QMS85358.1 DNA-directed RNA polymerase subunit beta [Xianfuyuplasma coldseepsis]
MGYKIVKYGKVRDRRNYSRVKSNVELPDLIKVQTESFKWFIEKGLAELFRDISPIQNFTEEIEMYFEDYELSPEKYDINESKIKDMTYSRPLRVNVKLVNKETGEIKQQKIFMGDFPMMTPTGSFIINGSERVIVSQIVRSAGVFFSENIDKKTLKSKYLGQVIPTRGAWLEYEMGSKNVLFVKLDRSKKIPLTTLLRALGFSSSEQIVETYGDSELLSLTLAKDPTNDSGEAIKEVYSKLRQGETATIDGAKSFLMSRLFDAKRYDLAEVGRFKINKKLDVLNRVHGKRLAYDLVDPDTGEIIVEKNTFINRKVVELLKDYRHLFTQKVYGVGAYDLEYDFETQLAAFRGVHVGNDDLFSFMSDEALLNEIKSQEYQEWTTYYNMYLESKGMTEKIFTEQFGKPHVKEVKAAFENIFDNENIYFELAEIQVLEIFSKDENDEDIVVKVIGNNSYEDVVHIVPSDIVASISYYLNLFDRVGSLDDIDHLGNRRLRLIGELLKNQFRIGLTKMEKNVKDRMSTKEPDEITPQKLINIRPLTSSLKEFFGSSQLSQFMAQTNPLDELTHKRRISALGPGGLTRDRAGFEVRDVHNSHYGRICPIETPEGQNIGLINSLASYVKVNKYGFMETPYLKVDVNDKGEATVTDEMVYLSADEEERFVIAQGNTIVGDDMKVIPESVVARHQGETKMFPKVELELMDVSPKQIVSISTACIPFLEHDDANRALMGANMQRQAIPLLRPEAPFVGTGIEFKAAHDSGSALVATHDGVVEYVDSNVIKIRRETGELDVYSMYKFQRSNQGTCINQTPIVAVGDIIKASDTITDGPSMDQGELALGRNVVVAFMTWNGYNYEDAIIMSERLVKEDIYTSIHIEKYELEARDTKLGKEEITREIPHVSEEGRRYLDEKGIIIPGAEVFEGDILVGKVTPKGVTDPTPEDKLLLAIFGEKSREVRDTSLKVPHGGGGIVQSVKYFSRANGDELPPGVNEVVRIFIVQKRKINEGDKMAGRHGNKGVISKILPVEDMPYMEDGTPIDIMLNPLGVPSRMNIGQVLEIHLGMAAKRLGVHVATPVFDGVKNSDLAEIMEEAGMRPTGKQSLYSGQTGDKFDNDISVGVMYMIKLDHMVDDKLHARSVGPYTLVTQQPMGGKAQNGGQRFGEMEVWALEAYGAAYALQEMLTVKSDDLIGRNKVFRAIVDGKSIPQPSLPESFRVLTRELQSLGIYVELINKETGVNEANKSLVNEDGEDYISKYGFNS